MAYNVIYHADTPGFSAALQECRRMLQPNGELYVMLISKNTWSYQHADRYRRVDENTILRDEHETERDVPHFYVDLADIKKLFSEWSFVKTPVECREYNLEKPEYYSKHWMLMVKSK